MEEREHQEREIREIWPEAVWMPWDEPPMGELVDAIDRQPGRFDMIGRIEGVWWKHRKHKYHTIHPNCEHCGHLIPTYVDDWWVVRLLTPMIVGGEDIDMWFAYPPSLKRVQGRLEGWDNKEEDNASGSEG